MAGKFKIGCLLAAMWLSSLELPAISRPCRPQDVYVIFYATYNGRTGHVGIAVDRYEVKIRDCASCPGRVARDTVSTGRLLYFDLWPQDDGFDRERVFATLPAQYFRLPASSAEAPITVSSLITRGIPHEEYYACDGLLKIASSPDQDKQLVHFLDQLVGENRAFHAILFNCADFVELGLEHLLQTDLYADEKVLLVRPTTPNRLYQSLVKLPGVTVLKDPGERISGSFFKERILKGKQ